MDDQITNDLAKLLNQDQLKEAVITMAQILAQYRDELINQKFERMEVWELVIAFQHEMFSSIKVDHE